jgi:parvulin-like peptidyl-prolyl isomerase
MVIQSIQLTEYLLDWKRFAIMISFVLMMAACTSQSDILASVNGIDINRDDYNRALERRTSSNIADPETLKRQVLEELIEQELINQGASSLGVNISEINVQAEIDAQIEIAGSIETWQALLAQNNYTEEEWRDAQYDALVTTAVRNHLLEPYFGMVEQVQARHIVVRTNEEADAILERLKMGEDFVTLTRTRSIYESVRETDGDLGWFARNELFQPNLETYAFSLEPPQIAGPIATNLGYHIIQVLDKELRPVELERLPTLSENIFNAWLESLRQTAKIERLN